MVPSLHKMRPGCGRKTGLMSILFATSLSLTGCGGGGGGDTTTPPQPPTMSAPSISLFAGELGGTRGSADGSLGQGRLNYPRGVAVDADGNVVIADTGNCSVRQLTGSVLSTILGTNAGCISFVADRAVYAQSYDLSTVATDAEGNVYFARGNNLWKKPRGGQATALPIPVVSLAFTVSQGGDIFVKQSSGLNKISPAGVTTLLARFISPNAMAVAADGVLYLAFDTAISKIAPDGTLSTFAGSLSEYGSADGLGTAARFRTIYGLAIDAVGDVYVADANKVRKITPAGLTTTLAGSDNYGAVDGVGANARFDSLWAVAVDKSGNVFAADSRNSAIRRITADGVVTTVAGTLSKTQGSVDGPAAAARFAQPEGIAIDSGGAMYVADSGNYTIRKIAPTGTVSTLAGNPSAPGLQDGVGNAATFSHPAGIAVDTLGNVFVTERFNLLIRKLSNTNEVRTIVDLIVGRRFDPRRLGSVATDRLGNLYAAVIYDQTLAKFPPTGNPIALNCGVVCSTRAVATDSAGNIFVATEGSIRRIAPDGNVVTLAGDPDGMFVDNSQKVGSRDGIGADARFFEPGALTVDSAGNIFVADTGNHTIRKVTPAGVVTTIAGKAGNSGVITGALPGLLNAPKGIAVDVAGNLFVTTENAVVKITQ
jgi:sugar lactone lactonase YvrE